MLRLTVKATNPQRRRACRYQPPSSCRFLTQKNSREPGLRNDSQHPFPFKACHVDSLDDRLAACGRAGRAGFRYGQTTRNGRVHRNFGASFDFEFEVDRIEVHVLHITRL